MNSENNTEKTDGKIIVTLCSGTACYLMGGGALNNLGEHIPEEWKPYILIRHSGCLNHCTTMYESRLKPPYAQINGKIIAEATVDTLLSLIGEEIDHVRK